MLHVQALEAGLQQRLTAVQRFAGGLSALRDTAVASRAFNGDAVAQAVAARSLGLLDLRALLQQYQQQLADVLALPATTSVGVVRVCLLQLVAALAPPLQRCQRELHTQLPALAAAECDAFAGRVRDARDRLALPPSTPQEFVAHAALVAQVEAQRASMDQQHELVASMYELLAEFGIAAPAEELAAASCLDAAYAALR